MKETLTSANSRDFRQRYEGTFGNFCQDDKKPIRVFVKSVSETEVVFSDVKGVEYKVYCDSGIPFEFYPVDRRLANTPKGGVLFSCRRPARQYQRGVSTGNTTITDLSTGRSAVINFYNLGLLYDPDTDYLKALKEFQDGKRAAVALDSRFCVLGDKLCLFNRPIGTYHNGTAKVHKLFIQEVSDVVKRGKFEIKVELYDENNS